jgi:hypothetical protein
MIHRGTRRSVLQQTNGLRLPVNPELIVVCDRTAGLTGLLVEEHKIERCDFAIEVWSVSVHEARELLRDMHELMQRTSRKLGPLDLSCSDTSSVRLLGGSEVAEVQLPQWYLRDSQNHSIRRGVEGIVALAKQQGTYTRYNPCFPERARVYLGREHPSRTRGERS